MSGLEAQLFADCGLDLFVRNAELRFLGLIETAPEADIFGVGNPVSAEVGVRLDIDIETGTLAREVAIGVGVRSELAQVRGRVRAVARSGRMTVGLADDPVTGLVEEFVEIDGFGLAHRDLQFFSGSAGCGGGGSSDGTGSG